MAPDWTKADLQGVEHTMSQYRGRVVVMDFWATWCAPCVAVASPMMEDLRIRYRDRDVVVIGVHFDDTGEPAEYMREKGYGFTVIPDGGSIAEKYGVITIPTVVIVSKEGKVLHRQSGVARSDEEQWIEVIERALAS